MPSSSSDRSDVRTLRAKQMGIIHSGWDGSLRRNRSRRE